jgi:hypothetical protein
MASNGKSRAAEKTEASEAFEKFQKLTALALSEEDGQATEEARTAAVKAIEMLADEEGDLVVLPRHELEAFQQRIEGAQAALAKVKEAKREGIVMGAFGGLILAKSGMLK